MQERPIICAILNATPDSFYDGGKYKDLIAHGEHCIKEGADWLDIGGESTRPNAQPVSMQEELDRVIPLIEYFSPLITVSIDTTKPAVAQYARAAGASILNDVQGLQNPEMMKISASYPQTIIMHSRGTPQTMSQLTNYDDIISEVGHFLKMQAASCLSNRVWIDPGIGFAKTTNQSLSLLKNTDHLVQLGYPVLIGASRKSFIGHTLNKPEAKDRLSGSLAAVAAGFYGGARAFRVHDVAETKDVIDFLMSLSQF